MTHITYGSIRSRVALRKWSRATGLVVYLTSVNGYAIDMVKTCAPAVVTFEHIIAKYEGTRLGRQELLGDILDSAEGALWTRDMLEAARDGARSEYVRIVVAVDPAVSANVSSALTGIVVAGRGFDGRAYVLAALSGRFSPDGWARVAVGACAFCGTSFAPQRSTARFCSSRCRTAAHRSSHVCNAARARRATRGTLDNQD